MSWADNLYRSCDAVTNQNHSDTIIQDLHDQAGDARFDRG